MKALLVLSVLSCTRAESAHPASAAPPGAVLQVDGIPLTAQEVEPLAQDIALLYPEYSKLHLRRLALTNEFLPRLAVRARHAELWEVARKACSSPQALDSEVLPLEGGWKLLGLATWSAARRLPPGEWSPPLEQVGRWVRLRLDARSAPADVLEERLSVSAIEFPFVEVDQLRDEVERNIDEARLTVLDPAWEEVIPEAWKHRMHASKP